MFFLQEKKTKNISIENQCKSKKKSKKQFPLKINENQNPQNPDFFWESEIWSSHMVGISELRGHPTNSTLLGVAPQLLRSGHSRYGNSFPNAKCLFLSGLPPVTACPVRYSTLLVRSVLVETSTLSPRVLDKIAFQSSTYAR